MTKKKKRGGDVVCNETLEPKHKYSRRASIGNPVETVMYEKKKTTIFWFPLGGDLSRTAVYDECTTRNKSISYLSLVNINFYKSTGLVKPNKLFIIK